MPRCNTAIKMARLKIGMLQVFYCIVQNVRRKCRWMPFSVWAAMVTSMNFQRDDYYGMPSCMKSARALQKFVDGLLAANCLIKCDEVLIKKVLRFIRCLFMKITIPL